MRYTYSVRLLNISTSGALNLAVLLIKYRSAPWVLVEGGKSPRDAVRQVKTKEGGLLLLIRSSSGLRLSFALILALVLLASGFAVPAAAQSDLESEQEGDSGESDQLADLSQSGDNANQCVRVQPVSNTGNAMTVVELVIPSVDNIQDVLDIIDELDLDLEDIGSTIELDPEQAVECAQAVDQAATASDYSDYWNAYWEAYWSWYYGY